MTAVRAVPWRAMLFQVMRLKFHLTGPSAGKEGTALQQPLGVPIQHQMGLLSTEPSYPWAPPGAAPKSNKKCFSHGAPMKEMKQIQTYICV